MVSVKSFMKVFQAFACLITLSSAAVYAASTPDLDVEIKECEGSYESRVMCERTLGDGSTQTGSGWCKCSRGKLSGGCALPVGTYTEIRFGITTGQECRDCTVPSVTRGCGISAVVDETPTCGNWYSCGGGSVIEPDDPITPIVKDCTSGQVQYKPSGSCGTSERTCCSNGTWSGWDAKCSDESILLPEVPSIGLCHNFQCASGQHVVELATGCCCEYDTCGQTINGNHTACRCYSDSNDNPFTFD